MRFIGIDTPEVYGQVEPYGKEASAYTARAIPIGAIAWLETDVELRDRYVEIFIGCQAEAREADRGLWGLEANPANAPPAASPAAAPGASGSETAVFITNTGAKYHADGCRHLAKSKIPTSLSDAKSQGYEPCKGCRPPD